MACQGACTALGIINLHFHDMRHEATSRLFEAGLTIPEVALATGHKDWKQLARYANLRPEHVVAKSRGQISGLPAAGLLAAMLAQFGDEMRKILAGFMAQGLPMQVATHAGSPERVWNR
jgi:hypothetical protein